MDVGQLIRLSSQKEPWSINSAEELSHLKERKKEGQAFTPQY